MRPKEGNNGDVKNRYDHARFDHQEGGDCEEVNDDRESLNCKEELDYGGIALGVTQEDLNNKEGRFTVTDPELRRGFAHAVTVTFRIVGR